MKKMIRLGLLLAVLAPVPAVAGEPSLAEKLDILVNAYPDTLSGWSGNELVLTDGRKIEIDDGKTRDHFGKLEHGDVEDQLSQLYQAGPCEIKPAVNEDPGRIRSEPLMKALFGASKSAVAGKLVPVDWFGERLNVTSAQGVDKALAAVRDELAGNKELKKYVTPSAGVFNWRKVSGQSNLSVHSFGAAIDLNTKFADYWIWSGGKPGRVPVYKNKFPMEIVDIFERHGFIWGGRWYHYDTMHFEYRPEMIEIGRRAGVAACR